MFNLISRLLYSRRFHRPTDLSSIQSPSLKNDPEDQKKVSCNSVQKLHISSKSFEEWVQPLWQRGMPFRKSPQATPASQNLLWDNALILHSSNLVEKKCKILAQIRKKSALLIKAAASSCYARLHKLEKRHIRLFRSFCKSGNNDVFKWDLSMVSLPSIHPFWFYLWRAMHTAQLWL